MTNVMTFENRKENTMTKESKKVKVLVIDDDPDIITAVRLTLENAGYQIVSASSGQEGVDPD